MATTTTEFEIKAVAPPIEEVSEILVGFGPASIEEQEDVYYDVPSGSLFEFGVFLRIRDSANLDVKFNPDTDDFEHVACEETRFFLPIQAGELSQLRAFLSQFGVVKEGSFLSLEEFFEAVDLKPWVRIVKHRKIYRRPGAEFCVDDVEGLGTFVEIESADAATANYYTKWANSQGLVNLPVGYVELFLRKHDWETYKRGRYQLPEDREPTGS